MNKKTISRSIFICLLMSTILCIVMMHDMKNAYSDLHKDYMVLSKEYDRLAEESADKSVKIENLQNTVKELKAEIPK